MASSPLYCRRLAFRSAYSQQALPTRKEALDQNSITWPCSYNWKDLGSSMSVLVIHFVGHCLWRNGANTSRPVTNIGCCAMDHTGHFSDVLTVQQMKPGKINIASPSGRTSSVIIQRCATINRHPFNPSSPGSAHAHA